MNRRDLKFKTNQHTYRCEMPNSRNISIFSTCEVQLINLEKFSKTLIFRIQEIDNASSKLGTIVTDKTGLIKIS